MSCGNRKEYSSYTGKNFTGIFDSNDGREPVKYNEFAFDSFQGVLLIFSVLISILALIKK